MRRQRRDCIAAVSVMLTFLAISSVVSAQNAAAAAPTSLEYTETAARSGSGPAAAADGSFQSPDGTPLSDAFVYPITALAGSPSGTVAIATTNAIRSVSGLSATSTLGTVATGITASELQYAQDGSLYALIKNPVPRVVEIAPDGTQTTVVGGGTLSPAAGVAASSVRADELNFAVDPGNDRLYFTENLDDTVWQVDPSTSDIEPLGVLPRATQFSATDLVVDDNHDVLADAPFGKDPRPLTRLTPDGTQSAAGCIGGPTQQLAMLANGTLTGYDADGAAHLCAPDGTDRRFAIGEALGAPTSDDRLLVQGDPREGGLLRYTAPLTAPASNAVPSATVAAEPGGATVTVTPPAVSGEKVTVTGFRTNGDAAVVSADFTTDGSQTPVTEDFDTLLHVWPQPAGSAAPVWQFVISAGEPDASGGGQLTDAPVVLTQALDVDTSAPAAPGLTLTNNGSSVTLAVTPPADRDLDRVVVCRSTSGAATDPHGCDEVADVPAHGEFSPFAADIDPAVTTSFTAFAVDDSGNVSSPTTMRRPAAILVSGTSPLNTIGYGPTADGEEIMWNHGGTAGTRYAIGSTPADPDAGFGPSNFFFSGTDGHGAALPLPTGTTATVSIFDWTDDSQTAFRKVSFTVKQGANTDSPVLTAPAAVDAGQHPTLVARVVRHSPDGATTALPGEYVTVSQRAAGTSTWHVVGGATTTAAGTAAFTAAATNAPVEFQVQHWLDTEPGQQSFSPIMRTSVRQVLLASVPGHVRHGRVMLVTGSVRPRRAATVDLERLIGRQWRTVAHATASTTDTNYALRYRPPTGHLKFRVLVPATSTLLADTTRAYTVVVN